jgi:NAD(P)H-hydrate epimerase
MTLGLGEDSSYVGPEHLEIIQNLLDRCQALVIGPGLGREPGTTQLLRTLLANTPLPAVLDADALWHFPLLSLPAKSNWVLTPHEGEFLRLGGDLSAREAGAAKLASTLGCVVHLKGHQSVTASPRGSLLINTTGNPGMAKGGSGDILAGLTGGFLARGISPEEAVAAAAWLLGTSADLCASEMGMEAMLPTDTLKFLPLAWKKGLE